ncbi:hypothetical protein EDB89DRAFT_262506 [Lactarius sanguifluus]|nr:hypothetical protein EDB89DRAFT_262506 [Lactarius sanguifluus]
MDSYYVDGRLVTDIFCALGITDGEHPSVFPALRTRRVFDLGPMHWSLSEAVESFTKTRRHSSDCVQVYARECSCKICGATSFTTQEELKKHFVVWHAYRVVCPYCGDFEFTPRYSELFREHRYLPSKHPEVPHHDTDTLITNSASQSSPSSYIGSHGTQQNDLHASVTFERLTEFKVTLLMAPTPGLTPSTSCIRLNPTSFPNSTVYTRPIFKNSGEHRVRTWSCGCTLYV